MVTREPATTAILGLGSNLGDRVAILAAAGAILEGVHGVVVEARSRLVATEAWVPAGAPPGPPFLNAALRVRTTRDLPGLLAAAHATERVLGRVRGERWAARTLDVDVLWSAAGPFRAPALEVPHPGLMERPFALAPLLDVLPADIDRAPFEAALAALGGRPDPGPPWPAPHAPAVPGAPASLPDEASAADAVVLATGPPPRALRLHVPSMRRPSPGT